MKRMLIIAAAVAAIAALGDDSSFARGTSAAGRLDLRMGTRIAAEGVAIPIAYSPRWGNAVSCTVAETGKATLVAAATDEGTATWTPSGTGAHTLTHTAGDLTYTEQFTVPGDDVAVHAGTLETNQTDVVWRKELVHLIVEPVTVPLGVVLTIEPGTVVKFMPGTALTVPRVSPTSPYMCQLSGAIFTHAYDDTVGGDTLMDGDETIPVMGDYSLSGIFPNDGVTEYRYRAPQTLPASVTSDTCLTGYRVYIVSNSVTVASGATLTLQPGTILKFNTGCSLTVNGTLDAQGTRAAPIVFTSLKDDEYGGDTNGDGEKTYPYAGDWGTIIVSGVANFNYVSVFYGGSGSDVMRLNSSGTINFDNSELAHAGQYAVDLESGSWRMCNSIFRDFHTAFRHWATTFSCVNSVFYDCMYLSNNGGQNFTNCIISRYVTALCWWTDDCTYNHCVIWNPVGFGPQSSEKVGSNGNIWGDPMFVDAENGDFRIQKGSACINTGDAANAPEFDYYGQPRDDRPDVGIYEAVGNLMSANDLAAVAVNAQAARSTIGDTLTISYEVANAGKRAIDGSWRDKVTLVSVDGGYSIDLGTVVQTAALAVGARNTFNASFTVPTDAEGTWRVQVGVNVERDIYEGANITNNVATSEGTVEVSLLARAASDGFSGTATKGAPASAKFALDGAEPMVARINAPAGTVVYFGSGFMPSASSHSARAVVGADGGLIGIPAGVTSAYLLVETTSSNGAAFTMTLEPAALAVQSVSPATLPYTGTTGLVIDGANFAEGCRVELGSVQFAATVVSPTRLTAQIDCSRLTAGAAYGVKVIAADGATATLPNAVTVAKVPAAPKLKATLDAPASVRRGRTLTVYIDYENVGNADLPAPIFELISEGQVFKIDGAVYTNSVKVMGLSAEAPVGTLRPGEPQRIGIPVTILAENVRWKLKSYHAAQEGSKTAKFSLRELYDDDWVLYHVAEDDGTVANLRTAIGSTFADYYTNLGSWLGMVEPQTKDYETLKSAFGKYQYLKASGMLDAGEEEDEEDESSTGGSPVQGMNAQAASSANTPRLLSEPKNGCSHERLASDWLNAGNGSIFKLCPTCKQWHQLVAYIGTDNDADWRNWYKIMEEGVFIATNCTYVICHGNRNSVDQDWVKEMGQSIMDRYEDASDVMVLAVNWGKDAYKHGSHTAHTAAGAIPEVADEAARQLAKLGVVPDNTILIGHSHGAHVAANIVCHYQDYVKSSGRFKRFVGLDTSTTGNGIHSIWPKSNDIVPDLKEKRWYGEWTPEKWISEIREKCEQTEFYKTSWDMSLEETSEMYGHYNFAVIKQKKGFFEYKWGAGTAIGEEVSQIGGIIGLDSWDAELARHTYAHQWFIKTIKEASSYKHLGFNFTGAEPWCALAGYDIAVPNSSYFAAVIRDKTVEFIDCRNSRSPWRYIKTAIEGQQLYRDNGKDTKSFRALKNVWTATAQNNLLVTIPKEVGNGMNFAIELYNNADNLSISYDYVFNAETMMDKVKSFFGFQTRGDKWRDALAYEHGTVKAWLVDIEGLLGGKEGQFVETYSGFTNLLAKASNPTDYFREVGVTTCDFPLPKDSASKGCVKIVFDNNVFDSERPLLRKINGAKDYRRVALVVSAGNFDTDSSDAWVPRFDLYPDNNFVVKEVEANPSGPVAVISKAASSRKAASLKSVRMLAAAPTHQLSTNALKPGEVVQVTADKNGNWSIDLDASESYTTDDEEDITVNRFELTDTAGKKGMVAMHKTDFGSDTDRQQIDFPWVTVHGQLPMTTDADGNPVCEGERYTVQLTVFATGEEEDVTTCILDVRSPIAEDTGMDEAQAGSTEPKSCDPNEMVGEEGIGERRLVMPGQELTYTIYFENKADAEAAAACVEVINSLNEWLDWSSLTMIDVGFNNHVDSGLNGKHEGESEKALDGTNTTVRTEFAVNEETGVAEWYLRIIDPNGDSEGWPLDMTGGFLPPNDDTHCGEGYIRYSIRVRDDAPSNVVITNSATIIFDHFNDPIETDPAWWNTVGRQDWIDVATDFVGAAKGIVTSKTDAKTGVTTLTAKPSNKNSLFAYWIGPDGEKAGFGATLNVKAATQGGKYTAVFTTKTACAKPSLDKSNAFAKGGAQMFNSVVGVAASDRFVVPDACYPVKFSVKGMPKGLKVNATSGAITGIPAKAGKYTATVTMTSVANAKKKVTVKVPITIAKLPKWTYGTFTGLASPNDARDLFENGSSDENDVVGSAKMTIAATGKMTLNVLVCGTNWTASASGFAATSDCGNERYDVKFTAKAKVGKKTISRSFALTLVRQSIYDDANGGATVALDTAFYDSHVFIGTGLYMKRYMWKDSGAAAALAPYTGAYTYYTADNEKLTLTVAANGAVKVAGALANGRKLSLSTYVVLAGDGWDIPCVLVYAPATTAKVKVGKTTRTVKYGEFFEQVVLDNHYSPPEPGYGIAYRNAGLKPSAEGSGTGTFAYSPAYGQAGSNKVVTVTAKPAKNSVFAYWTRNGEIVSYSPTYKVTMLGGDDTSLWAEFRLKSDFNDVNLAPWWEDADGNELEKTEIAEILKWRLFTGLKTTLKFCVDDGVRPVKFSATGLPKGMSLNATTGVLSGIPTAASSGTIKITVASTANTKKKVTQSFKWQVRKLRKFAQGTFKGEVSVNYISDDRDENGYRYLITNSVEKTWTVTVGANGKASGKVTENGKTYVLSTSCYSSYQDASTYTEGLKTYEDETFTAKGTVSCGGSKWPATLVVRETGDMNPVATKATRATDVNPKGYGAWTLDTLMTVEADLNDIGLSSEIKRIK